MQEVSYSKVLDRLTQRSVIMRSMQKFMHDMKLASKGYRKFKSDCRIYDQMTRNVTDEGFRFRKSNLYPCISDIYEEAGGELSGHYFLQDYWMAREVLRSAPKIHYDIGSRVDGFLAHLLCADSIEQIIQIDIRPLSISLDRLGFIQADAMSLDGIPDDSILSISSLHAIEHFGLGRYGDPIDPEGWHKSLLAIESKLRSGGMLYLSVPIGKNNKLYFNGHRVFRPSTIIEVLKDMKTVRFGYIHEQSVIELAPDREEDFDRIIDDGDCGLFIFEKL